MLLMERVLTTMLSPIDSDYLGINVCRIKPFIFSWISCAILCCICLLMLLFLLKKCAVRAATEGRILVLEGLEKAERNVLPVLNNLLENREMQLEDGRFLMSAERYDKLLQVQESIMLF